MQKRNKNQKEDEKKKIDLTGGRLDSVIPNDG